jgi:spermidine synthase
VKSPQQRQALPVGQVFEIATGQARLVDWSGGGVLLEINGEQHSLIYPNNPLLLEFEYMAWMFTVTQAHFDSSQALRAVHLGGGACAFPRALAHAFPRSRHLVFEVDPVLAGLVRAWFDLPRSPTLRIRVGDAVTELASRRSGSADLIVRDAFLGGQVPEKLVGQQFAAEVSRVLSNTGLYLANCAGPASLATAKADVAALAKLFPTVSVIAEPSQLRGRRWGNIVVAAGSAELANCACDVVRSLASLPFPARLLEDQTARAWAM